MSAPEVAAECVKRIESGKYDVVILNFANCDMVGHTGVSMPLSRPLRLWMPLWIRWSPLC